jgi:hypothetical protein
LQNSIIFAKKYIMGAPTGNHFWKQRSKHGRDRIINDPNSLEESAIEYFQWCEDNPVQVTEVHGKDASLIVIPKRRVFQKDALALFCGVATWRTIDQLKEISKDFLQVITRIENIIKTQKFEGASIGQFNSNIIARDLGLVDNKQTEHTVEIKKTVIKWGDKEISI